MKRKRKAAADPRSSKKSKLETPVQSSQRPEKLEIGTRHPVLSCYYRQVCTLRAYILRRLRQVPKGKNRAIKRLSIKGEFKKLQSQERIREPDGFDAFLDGIVVGSNEHGVEETSSSVRRGASRYAHDLAAFLLQVSESRVGKDHPPNGNFQIQVRASSILTTRPVACRFPYLWSGIATTRRLTKRR
jgi:hypothetical protein